MTRWLLLSGLLVTLLLCVWSARYIAQMKEHLNQQVASYSLERYMIEHPELESACNQYSCIWRFANDPR